MPTNEVCKGNVFTCVCLSTWEVRGSLLGGLCWGDLCPRGSLSGGVSVQGVSVHWGFFQGGGPCSGGGSLSRRGSLCRRGLSVQEGVTVQEGVSVQEVRWRAGGTHPTGMHSCSTKFLNYWKLVLSKTFRVQMKYSQRQDV